MIRILTDSASDILPAEAAQLGVSLVPLNVTFEDGSVIRDGVDLTPSEFYTRMETCHHLPMTSQPSPELFERFFREADEAGDIVIGIFLSHELSGTYQCASLAAAETDAKVYIIDSETATQGEAIIVREAIRLREQGLSASRIAAELETFKKRVRVVAIVDSLKHLQKGGRLPAAVAIVGGALGIKPVLALFDGAIHLVDKGRGRPGALVAMYRQLDKQGGVDPAYGYTLVYSDDKQLTAPVHHYLHQNLHLTGGRVGQIGPTIGTHIGPGAVGVAFVIPE